MIKQLFQKKLLLLWLVIFTLLVFAGNTFLSSTFSSDSQLIQDMADGFVEPGSGSYAATAMFFRLFPAPLDVVLILVMGWVSLYMFMVKNQTLQSNMLAFYMTFPAMVTCMIRPQKETIVIILAVLVAWVTLNKPWSKWWKLAFIVGAYAVYAALFRQYFFLIIAAFAGVYMMIESRNLNIAVMIALLGVAIVLMTPVDFLYDLQYPRDMVNYNRIGSGLPGHRTAFMNPYPIDSSWNFILNYLYVVVRLNIPMVFDLSPKAWFWFGSVVCYVFVLVKGLKNSTDEIRILSALFMAHVSVLLLFEPDTGSYTRHITSVFVYLTPSLMVVDNYFQQRRELKHKQLAS